MTIYVFNTKTHKVGLKFDAKPSNEDLDAACAAVPNGFAEELQNLKLTELASIYNANHGPDANDIKKFPTKTYAVERVSEVLKDVPAFEPGKKVKVATTTTTLAEGVAKSWTDPQVREARSQRHGIKVDGKEYTSILAAYRDLNLDLKFHRDHRKALKAAMPRGIKDDKGRMWKAFER